MNAIKIVTGAGPVGWTVASQLAEAGHHVRVLTRSGSGPEHPLVERLRVDAGNPTQLAPALAGADAVFHCIHGSRYSADVWRRELPGSERAVLTAAGEAGAVVIFPESLYSYSSPDRVMAENSPRQAAGGKRGVRTELLAGRAASDTPTVSVVASDFFGPRVLTAHAGDRMVPLVLDGKRVQVLGSADLPHSFTYVPDLAAAMIRAAERPQLWNSVLHAPTNPALAQREMVAAFAQAAGVPAPRVGAIPGWTLQAAGIFSADMRELAEMAYQFRAPFIMESAASEQLLGLAPTPLEAAARETVEWWRSRAQHSPGSPRAAAKM
ncbi:nucleoside-diphosphate-sugar epimerase [Arthrobacter stackebrandtii]|uniref:Nucleoside-diphosphate-sugar epimerase n=1 Tax=Arthrobacter stackebrandtii TaxID=272161 RepID=A0ABS4YXQ1_9MICC|nr:NAD-dependent epimerase/dehydratase family protein [Arthrobacter stackebrandtii]MBP2413590.1 nucleoside-diphosphate-sugar epimerase [Arthrobacter stackebrandtii]PYH00587.1 epimerase [Arthrobacter stackebrandtii]